MQLFQTENSISQIIRQPIIQLHWRQCIFETNWLQNTFFVETQLNISINFDLVYA